jgi:condensin-2 complex subunit G2
MANRLRILLETGIHSQKRQPGVDAMLMRLYEPILWRNLGVANVAVRKNALLLLFSAFPLRDPDAAIDDIEMSELRQWEAFRVRFLST